MDLENEVLDATKALKESQGVSKHWVSKFEALKVEYAQDQVIPNPEHQRSRFWWCRKPAPHTLRVVGLHEALALEG